MPHASTSVALFTTSDFTSATPSVRPFSPASFTQRNITVITTSCVGSSDVASLIRMALKFPSGRVSVSIRELQETQLGQPCCGVCEEHWVIEDDKCIMGQLLVLHPCQHLVGSSCWSTVPDEQKEECPVCEVKILCKESVHVHNTIARFDTSMEKKLQERIRIKLAESTIGGKKVGEGLTVVDVEAIMGYFDIRARLETAKADLGPLFPSARDLTPEQREQKDLFLDSIKQYDYGSEQEKIAFALFAFNISREADFTLEDLKKILPSTSNRIKGQFAAIFEDKEKTPEDAQPKIGQEESATTQQKDG